MGPTFLISNLPDDVTCNTAIYTDETTLNSKCHQASYLLQQLELASELGSELQDTVDWGRKWLVDFSGGKTQLISFDQSNISSAIDAKMEESVPEEKSSFKLLGLSFSFKLNWGSYIVSNAKTAYRKWCS